MANLTIGSSYSNIDSGFEDVGPGDSGETGNADVQLLEKLMKELLQMMQGQGGCGATQST